MPRGDYYELTVAPDDVICTVTSAAGGAASVETAVPNANAYWLITGYDITADGAPSAGISGGITHDGTIFYPIRIPGSAFAPVVVNFGHGIAKGTPTPTLGKKVGITMGAIGGSAVQTASLRGRLLTVGGAG